ncbi:DUF3919 family protein [Haloimpatiens sp. FM7330]|uniref:DUF3919 family protein n=1 Tax=Haloimpatiens sp. FM7330 TaxID=3298610 RepID=UPI0036316C9F
MKRINTKMKIILVYIVVILTAIIITWVNQNKLFDKVIIIDDKKEVIKKANMSIPIKIKFYNRKWGNCILEDQNSINNVWSYIQQITKDASNKGRHKASYDSPVSINGTVYYLNGMKDEFEVSDVLKINDHIYGDRYNFPMINNLRSHLLNYLYSPNNLSNFINNRNKVILVKNENVKRKLGNFDKERIKQIISKAEKIEDDKSILKLTRSQNNLSAYIKVYMDMENDNYIKVKSYNVINIDVYDGFFVVQYLGDENGRHIYMKGDLSPVCNELIKTYSEHFN